MSDFGEGSKEDQESTPGTALTFYGCEIRLFHRLSLVLWASYGRPGVRCRVSSLLKDLHTVLRNGFLCSKQSHKGSKQFETRNRRLQVHSIEL